MRDIVRGSQLWRFIYHWGPLEDSENESENICKLAGALVIGIIAFTLIALLIALLALSMLVSPVLAISPNYTFQSPETWPFVILLMVGIIAWAGVFTVALVSAARFVIWPVLCFTLEGIGKTLARVENRIKKYLSHRRRRAAWERDIKGLGKEKPEMKVTGLLREWYTAHKEKFCVEVKIRDPKGTE